jgi:hypothetical protein
LHSATLSLARLGGSFDTVFAHLLLYSLHQDESIDETGQAHFSQSASAGKDLSGLRATVHLAQEVGEVLG